MYFYGIIFRYSIGTAHCHRFQTLYKTYSFPKFFEIVLFIFCSKCPIAFHSIFTQISNIILILLLLLDVANYFLVLRIFLIIQVILYIILFLETIVFCICFNEEYVSSDKRINMDFQRDRYTIIINNKKYEGYLDLYFPKKYIFYSSEKFFNNKILDFGTYYIKSTKNSKAFCFTSKNKRNGTEYGSLSHNE